MLAGFLHGALDATAFSAAPLLRWTYLVAGTIGLAFYVYRELVARHLLPHHDYQVAHVERLAPDLVEVALAPRGRPLAFVPGQFAIVYVESRAGWRRHPFTLASAPGDPLVRVTVKALGDYTSRLHELVEPGMPAVIGGPHGRFDRRRGTSRQLWIAGGVGVAPFLSWLRALDGDLADTVDLFVSSDGPSPFAAEIEAIAARHPTLRVHLVDTRVDGRLDPARALALAGGDPRELSAFMCGPEGMLRTFERAFRAAGVPRGQIAREHFGWR